MLRNDEVKAEFLQVKNMWDLKQLLVKFGVRIFNTIVKTVLLYGDETWRSTTTIVKMYKYL